MSTQGATYMCKTYPQHCDPLALVSVIYEQEQAA